VYQNILFETVPFSPNQIRVTNRYDFKSLDDLLLPMVARGRGVG